MEGKSNFRVVIVGGGIAGLALANELQKADVDFVLLEGRSVIDPQAGASIGMLPNGSRILDQVGCYEDILALVEPVKWGLSIKENGSPIGEPTDAPILTGQRAGYDVCFLDRRWVLRILADHVEDQNKILLNKRVVRIEQNEDKATVFCTDGTSVDGHIVVGADGVFSITRHEMWRQIEEAGEGKRIEKDKQAMSAEYQCLFGISSTLPGMIEGENRFTYGKDRSALMITGKNGRIFWFVFAKMDKIYKPPNIPKFSDDDREKFVQKQGDLICRKDPNVTVKDLYDAKISATLVALEEAEYETWSYGRITCAGDAIHKMTPNLGAGGNSAVETTAIIANQIKRLADEYKSTNPPLKAVRNALETAQKLRHTRITETMKMANGLTRIQAMKTPIEKFVAYYIIPYAGDFLADMYSDFQIGAPILEYLPPPPRSLEATMPFNPVQGWGFIESKAKRAFLALPFIGLAALFYSIMLSCGVIPHVEAAMEAGKITYGNATYSLLEKFYPVPFLDSIWRGVETFFLPSTLALDPVSHKQAFTFLIDVGTLYAIWLIESSRRSNKITLAQVPVLFGFLMQLMGIGFIGPVYYFLFYTYTPIASFRANDSRLTNKAYTYTVLPIMILFYIAPVFLMFHSSDLGTRHYWMFAWQMFQVWVFLGQWIVAKWIIPDTFEKDRIYDARGDVQAIKLTVGAFTLLSAAAWIWTVATSPFSLTEMFIPTTSPEDSLFPLARYFWQMDQMFGFGAAFLGLAYAFGDMKSAGMIKKSWVTILGIGTVSLLCLGPGATFAIGWLWREQTLLTKRHKSAVTKESVAAAGWNTPAANGKAVNGKIANGKTVGKIANGKC